MNRQLLVRARTWLRHVPEEKGVADLLLVALFAFIIGVIVTGHRIVVQ